MFTFPQWSDLGQISQTTRNTWEQEVSLRERYRYYFDGNIFRERIPLEVAVDEQSPLLYPVGLNLVKMLCLSQADSAFGEWNDQNVIFEVAHEDVLDDGSKAGIDLLNKIITGSSTNSKLWEIELDRNIYGGGAMKISADLPSPGHVKWSRVPLQSFFPVFDPDDPDKLLEVYVVIDMTPEQAKLKFGYDGTSQIVKRLEHWTPSYYTNTVDGKRIDAYSGVNPWGMVPFTYIPRYRSSMWFGEALTEEIIPVQDEMNMRIADMGEAINYNAHPVRYGLNLPKSFNVSNFPLDPNALWDLGRTLGNSPPPEVGILEAKNPVPAASFDYINFLYDWSRTSSFSPPIAFGDDNGGGQRSGATLEIRMWPLIKATRRSRMYMAEALTRAAKMTAVILQQKKLPDVPAEGLKAILDGKLLPHFANILPKDHVAVVDEVVKLMSTEPKTISLETAQKILDRGVGEVDRIREMLKDKELNPPPPEPKGMNDLTKGVKGKSTPQTESK